ncbi:MAG: hypothetical protein Q4B01_04670 [Eubacteriales bacterium]|nr:hypothetical protein [Eubacteriales bacterium]
MTIFDKYLSVTNIIPEAKARLSALRDAKEHLETQLANSPEGKIHVTKRGNQFQYYLRQNAADKSGVYLPKHKQKLAAQYLQKSYNEKALTHITKEISILEKLLKNYPDFPEQIRRVYSLFPEQARIFIEPIDISDEEFAREWMAIESMPKSKPNQESAFLTEAGEYVRSKSELIIANTLRQMNIPYKYECPLELRKGLLIYPDFTVLNIRTRTEYYWEHRGMMDDRGYSRDSIMRLREYGRSGIYMGKRLIISEETSTSPLGSQEVKDIIHAYLI